MNVILIGKGNLAKAFQEYSLSHQDFKILDMIDEKMEVKDYQNVNAVIDFSSPEAILVSLNLATKYDVPLIIGTTNYAKEQEDLIKEISKKIVICKDANFSLGFHILKKFKSLIDQINVDKTTYIIETHQKHKLDKPSGSSKLLKLNDEKIFSLRGSSINGEHEIRVFLENEEISIKHQVHSRIAFVDGVIRILSLLCDKEPGLYTYESFVEEIYGN